MTRRLKRYMAMLLAFFMVLTMLPVSARAEECAHVNKRPNGGIADYVPLNATYHTVLYHHYYICTDCGAGVWGETSSSTEYHNIFYLDNYCMDCGYRPGSTHFHEYTASSTETTLVMVDSTYHNVVTTTYTACSCGAAGEPEVSTVSEAHSAQYYAYDAAHPHQQYSVCGCGAKTYVDGMYDTANGTLQDAAVCCVCNGHVFGAAQEVSPGNWQKTCGNCGITQTADAPGSGSTDTPPEETPPEETLPEEIHVHSFRYGPSSHEHPHFMTGYCACGATTTKRGFSSYCCQCSNVHHWGDAIRLPDGSFRQVCSQCDIIQTTLPSDQVLTYYKVIDMIVCRHDAASVYQEAHEIDSAACAIWKTIAGQATDKLTEIGFVGGNEFMNTYSDMKGSVVGVFTQESWDQQQTELWKTCLIEMLQSRELNTSSVDPTKDVRGIISGALKDCKDIAGGERAQLEQTTQQMKASLDLINAKLDALKAADSLPTGSSDFSEHSSTAHEKLLALRDKYDAEWKEAYTNEDDAGWIEDNATMAGYYMDFMDILIEGGMKAGVDYRYSELLMDLQRNTENAEILDSIIQLAKATKNANLENAATELLDEINAEKMTKVTQFLSAGGAFLEGFALSFAEKVVEGGIDAAIDAAAEKGMETALGAAGTIVKESLKILEIIELGAKVTKFIFDWDEAYDEAQILMTINYMDATLNVVDILKENEAPYMAELWGVLQAKGCEHAQTFLEEWEDGTGLSVKDFGIKQKGLPGVITQLELEKNYYINTLSSDTAAGNGGFR